MRKSLAAGAVLASLFLAGCSAGGGSTPPSTGDATATQATESSKPASARTAPAKSLDVTDSCSLVTEQQAKALGVDQPLKVRDEDGLVGCDYQRGEAGALGWGAHVAIGKTTFSYEVDSRDEATKMTDIEGYPLAEYDSGLGCVLFADVSDSGHLMVNILRTSPDDPGIDMCQQAEKFAEAAIKNFPNA
ncbi:DUF3558 domain-containing protein [Saccharopolyspora sp. ASAGF58]|uniref:DUF3558 domain-containing protein n=1 Tax=Saccharopolyspora sp. ASAGF58 TaxID=2719023 RepID=UPI001444E1BC|nr:DUF3558 domain-containing protein [Saccharopolyspora sp. ASAGF58]